MSESPTDLVELPSPQVEVVADKPGTTIVSATLHSGPLPDPRSFAEYERILPGAANRILMMAEKSQQIRHETFLAAAKETARGQWIATGLVGGILFLTLLVILLHQDPRAYIALFVELIGLGYAYLNREPPELKKPDDFQES